MVRQHKPGDKGRVFIEKPPLPKNLMVELTNACNHACIFCTNPHMQRKIGRLSNDLLFRVMKEARDGGVTDIGFYTTGDPFVHKSLEAFVAEATRLGFDYIYISTNGALATQARAKAVIDAGIKSIKFSINAGGRESYRLIHGKDEWDKVLENLRYIAKYREASGSNFTLFATTVITKPMEHEVDALKELLAPLVDEHVCVPCGSQSGQMGSAQALLGASNYVYNEGQAPCALPFNRLHVTCEGYLTLCCVDYQNYLAVADLNELGLMEAWHGDAAVAARRMHLEDRLDGTLCGNCLYGKQDPIEPLDKNLASRIDFVTFYDETEKKVDGRIKSS